MASQVWQPAYIGLGSNLGDPTARLRAALDAIAALQGVTALVVSPFYRTAPFGPVEQPDFVNAAAGVLTTLDPETLHAALKDLELRLGRRPPRERWGPREIDLDLLAFGTEMRRGGELVLPHAGIPERDFVLYPLCDVAPELQLPGMGVVRQLAARVPDRGMRRLT